MKKWTDEVKRLLKVHGRSRSRCGSVRVEIVAAAGAADSEEDKAREVETQAGFQAAASHSSQSAETCSGPKRIQSRCLPASWVLRRVETLRSGSVVFFLLKKTQPWQSEGEVNGAIAAGARAQLVSPAFWHKISSSRSRESRLPIKRCS